MMTFKEIFENIIYTNSFIVSKMQVIADDCSS